MVRASVASAAQADALARQAASTASQGGEVVASVETVIDEILSGARRIADIVGVIELHLLSRPTSWRSMRRWRRRTPVRRVGALLWWRPKCAAWRSAWWPPRTTSSSSSSCRWPAPTTARSWRATRVKPCSTSSPACSAWPPPSARWPPPQARSRRALKDVRSAAVGRLDDMTQRNAALVEQLGRRRAGAGAPGGAAGRAGGCVPRCAVPGAPFGRTRCSAEI